MAEENDRGGTDAPARRGNLFAVYSLAVTFGAIAGFSSIFVIDRLAVHNAAQRPDTEATPVKSLDSGLAKLVRSKSPKSVADFTFSDGDGAEKKLSDFRGKVVLVNLWATWCAPCKVEMPGLNNLQAQLGGSDFAVLPISLDLGGPDKPRHFLETNELRNLGLYQSASTKLIQQFGAPGLPFTMLIDREGREIARLAGPAEWDSPEAIAIIREAMAPQG